MLFGFDIEGARFSLDYVKEKFNILENIVTLLEVPVYVFIKNGKINTALLKGFLDISSSYNFKFTAHADDSLSFISPLHKPWTKKLIQINIKVAEKIGALKINFHQFYYSGKPVKVITSIPVTIENNTKTDPLKIEALAKENGIGFTLDIPHMFIYYAEKNMSLENCYLLLKEFSPEHLHISNTYFKHNSLIDSIFYLVRRDFSSAFVKLRGDFHLPLFTGHINYHKVFKLLKIPETVIMEISTKNYELILDSRNENGVEKGYKEDVKYFLKLLKERRKL